MTLPQDCNIIQDLRKLVRKNPNFDFWMKIFLVGF
jgi:hypothetical protein